jgi:uncharacterized membrane protein
MENDEKPAPSNPHPVRRLARRVGYTRLVMGVLLIVAMWIFINLADQAVHENADAIRQSFGR